MYLLEDPDLVEDTNFLEDVALSEDLDFFSGRHKFCLEDVD